MFTGRGTLGIEKSRGVKCVPFKGGGGGQMGLIQAQKCKKIWLKKLEQYRIWDLTFSIGIKPFLDQINFYKGFF